MPQDIFENRQLNEFTVACKRIVAMPVPRIVQLALQNTGKVAMPHSQVIRLQDTESMGQEIVVARTASNGTTRHCYTLKILQDDVQNSVTTLSSEDHDLGHIVQEMVDKGSSPFTFDGKDVTG
eukprot:COSAG06_NODE_36220_length_450_cov_0.709402_1_plen_122_part_10